MEGHLADIIGKFAPPDLKPADTPAPTSLFIDEPDPPSADTTGGKASMSDDEQRRATRDWQRRNQPLDPERKAIFHSCVMSLILGWNAHKLLKLLWNFVILRLKFL